MIFLRFSIALLGTIALSVEALSPEYQCDRPAAQQQLFGQRPAACRQKELHEDAGPEAYSHPIWSHSPFCISRPDRRYCTHTTQDFRNRKGLSIIASSVAAEAATRAFGFARRAPSDLSDQLEVRDIPGKGKGLIAGSSVKRGQIIMLDSPRIIASAQFPARMTRSEGLQLFNFALNWLPDEDRNLVLSLDKSLGGTDIENIMKTNSFACQIDDGGVGDGYMCLFPSVSRINHACRPNAHARFIPRTLLMEIKALRDIAPGEEISISYGSVDLKHADRQKLYKEGWGFKCTCDVCTADAYTIAGSDQRRGRFSQLRERLNSLTAETYDAQQIVAWEKEVLELSEKEGLDVLVAEDLERMAYVYAGLGLVEEAKSWARKARLSLLEWTIVDGGSENDVRRVEELLRELGG
ncbi:SET domain-containing protein [Trematosphaeria pertusa]|uniref:SET domain-containing protein n=1 Tax=Trematosphaeria pertusa TaxID=390896 RepID=A0A6A6IEL2_9PLEO|nr:SET domain-containing protein [Trematosphaeria pertusa]KAF2248851.1 SET domain-containing protein [Trematosphaeria pertusa]